MYYDEDSNYDYIMDDVYEETASRIKFLDDFDIDLLMDFDWKEETYQSVLKLLGKPDNFFLETKDLLELKDRKELSKIFQKDEILLDQFSAEIEKIKEKEREDVDVDDYYDYC